MTKEEIYSRLKQTFLANQNKLSDIDEPGVIYALFQAFASELEELYNAFDDLLDRAFMDTATGEDLDRIGALVGCERKSGSKATGTLRFSRSTPADRDYFIPKGTRARTPLLPDRTYLSFETTEDAILEQGQTYVNVQAQSIAEGSQYNVPADSILLIETPVAGVEEVTNPSPFQGGSDPESDDEYRQRIPLYLEGLKRATKTALKSCALSVEGVSDVIVEDGETPGTAIVTIASYDGVPSQELLDQVSQALEEYRGAGIQVTVQAITTVTADVTFDLYVLSGYDTTTVKTNAENAVTNYLNNLSIGAPAQIAEIIAEVMKVEGVDNIKNVKINGVADDLTVATTEKVVAGSVTGTVI